MNQLLVLYTTLGLFFVGLLIGQAALGKAYLENRLRLPPAGCLVGLIAICIGLLLILAFVILPRSYVDFFALESLTFPLGWSWWTAGCFALAIAERSTSSAQRRRDRIYGLVVGSLLVLAGVWGINHLAQNVLALTTGPTYGTGTLQESHWSGGRASQYYAQIDNVSYLIPNPAWLAPYQRGQHIQFAYSITSTHIAVAPADIGVSVLGGCLIGLALFAWIVTALGVGMGYQLLWRARSKHVHAPPANLDRQAVPRRTQRRMKLSRRQRHQVKKL